jgi:hypothetical protein
VSVWDQAEVDTLTALVVGRFSAAGWPEDAGARDRLGKLADGVDLAFEARDLGRLRPAAEAFLVALDGGSKPLPVDGDQERTAAADEPAA